MKTIKNISLIVFTVFCSLVKGQDIIYKSDGTTDTVNIYEVTSAEIKYKNLAGENGPILALPRSHAAMILYANGDVKMFNPRTERRKTYNKNLITVDYSKFLTANLCLTYERLVAEGYVGLRASINKNLYFFYNNLWIYTYKQVYSAELVMYPHGISEMGFTCGPMVRWGQLDYPYLKKNEVHTNRYNYQSFLFNVGAYYHPSPQFYINMQLGLGSATLTRVSNGSEYTDIDGYTSLSMGWRF